MANPTQNGALKKDDNGYPVMGGTSSSDNATIINSSFDPTSRRLLVTGMFAPVATTWGAGGNSKTITDANVSASSFIDFMVTGTTQQAGQWSVQCGSGTFTIHSSDAESSTLAFTYSVRA